MPRLCTASAGAGSELFLDPDPGALGAHLQSASLASRCFVELECEAGEQRFGRAYLLLERLPPSNIFLLRWVGDAGEGLGVMLSRAGHLRLFDGAGYPRSTPSRRLPVGGWIRLEWRLCARPEAETLELRCFDPCFSRTPAEIRIGSGAPPAPGGRRAIRLGILTAAAETSIWLDGVAVDERAWPGPGLGLLRRASLSPGRRGIDLEMAGRSIIAQLESIRDPAPADLDPARWRYALPYAVRRFQAGLARYAAAVDAIGFADADAVLDAGSGSGHWSIVLATRNERVLGVERSPEFIHIAKRSATLLGLESRLSFRREELERLRLEPASFELACCHSVLQYIPDHELMLSRLGDWLRPGGRLYVGYTTLGAYLENIERAIEAGDRTRVRQQGGIVLSDQYYRAGIAVIPWSRARVFARSELIELARQLGLVDVSQPGVCDGAQGSYDRGLPDRPIYPHTFDVVFEKPAGAPATASGRPDAVDGLGPEERDRTLAAMIDAGLPHAALAAISRLAGHGAPDPDYRLYVRALLKADLLAGSAEQGTLDDGALNDARLSGELAFQRGDFRAAAGAFSKLPAEDDERWFLLGGCLLAAGRDLEAANSFRRAVRAGPQAARGYVGWLVAAADSAEPKALRRAFDGALECFDHSWPASPQTDRAAAAAGQAGIPVQRN